MKPIAIVSTPTLEDWDWETPWETGIGGSETSHIEMANRLAKSGHEVWSFSPSKRDFVKEGYLWHDSRALDYDDIQDAGVLINYRDPKIFDHDKPAHQKWWFVAQDVGYSWTPEQLEKVDRYLCLSPTHINYTLATHPDLAGRVFLSGNGIRTDSINRLAPLPPRDKNTMLYASSPDRGLKFLLEQWWRIKERNPDLKLRIAYGFENFEKIMAIQQDWRGPYKAELEKLMTQPDIKWLGRLPQHTLYHEWFGANIWPYPCDFPETSCITSMDAQACGAWPVTNNLWALDHNVRWGWMLDGTPQSSELLRSYWLENLARATQYDNEEERTQMMTWARRNHNWDNIVKQWEKWL